MSASAVLPTILSIGKGDKGIVEGIVLSRDLRAGARCGIARANNFTPRVKKLSLKMINTRLGLSDDICNSLKEGTEEVIII